MYKILIVDDEKWIRKGIISKLIYYKFSFSDIFEAENGQIAFDIIKAEKPHIVITDIRMPLVDGIELIRRTLKEYEDIKFLIVSGYEDFSYAEQAINMGVNGYILKPIRDKDFVQAIRKVMTDINRKVDIKRLMQTKEKLEKDKQNIFLCQKLNQALHTPNEMLVDDQKYSYFLLGIIAINSINFHEHGYKNNNVELIKERIKNVLNDVNKNCTLLITDNYNNNNQIIMLFMGDQKDKLLLETKRYIFEVFKYLITKLEIAITFGVSQIHEKIGNILYKEAVDALGLRLIYGYNKIYHFKNVLMNNTFVFPEEKIKLLHNSIRSYKINDIKVLLKEIFDHKNFQKSRTIHVKYVWLEIKNILIQFCRKHDYERLEVLEIDILSEDVFDKFDSLEDLVTYFYTTIIDLLKLEKVVDASTVDIIDKAKQYIQDHYSEEISVKELAYRLAINPNYLSTLFKKELGKKITTYLTDLRIEKACKLLLQTKASVAQISQSVGYQDSQYFYRVFKKNTGITPLAYRNKKE